MAGTPRSTSSDLYNTLQNQLESEVKHINELMETKLNFIKTTVDQRLETQEKLTAAEIRSISLKMDEALQEVRGYKEILQQQLVLLDTSVKSSHSRVDGLEALIASFQADIAAMKVTSQKTLEDLQTKILEANAQIETERKALEELQAKHTKEEIIKESQETDPLRIFIKQNGKKLLLYFLTAVGAFLLKNAPELLKFISGGG